jgi:ABC-type Zn uptake system ZnuABC Zn-binding protein ZnuA
MRIVIILIAIVLAAGIVVAFFLLPSLSPGGEGIVYVTTVHPAAEILKQVVGDRAKVVRLLSPTDSPHTYEPTPRDREKVEHATGLVYVAEDLDGWIARFPAKKKVELLKLLPQERILFMEGHHGEEHHGEEHGAIADPHFWTDPLAVKAILPNLVKALSELDPDGSEIYRANAERFAAELDAMHEEISRTLEPVKGSPVILFHPSFQYLLKRYGLKMAGVIEEFPGKEASPRYIEEMKHLIQSSGAKAVFTEPQLNPRPAEVVAEEAGVKLFLLDPLGGVEGRETYADLLRYNAKVLFEALR